MPYSDKSVRRDYAAGWYAQKRAAAIKAAAAGDAEAAAWLAIERERGRRNSEAQRARLHAEQERERAKPAPLTEVQSWLRSAPAALAGCREVRRLRKAHGLCVECGELRPTGRRESCKPEHSARPGRPRFGA